MSCVDAVIGLLKARFVTGAKRERNDHDNQNADCYIIENSHATAPRRDYEHLIPAGAGRKGVAKQ